MFVYLTQPGEPFLFIYFFILQYNLQYTCIFDIRVKRQIGNFKDK